MVLLHLHAHLLRLTPEVVVGVAQRALQDARLDHLGKIAPLEARRPGVDLCDVLLRSVDYLLLLPAAALHDRLLVELALVQPHLPALDDGAGHSLERPIFLCDNAWNLARDCVEAGEYRVEIAADRLHLGCERWVHGAGACVEILLWRFHHQIRAGSRRVRGTANAVSAKSLPRKLSGHVGRHQ